MAKKKKEYRPRRGIRFSTKDDQLMIPSSNLTVIDGSLTRNSRFSAIPHVNAEDPRGFPATLADLNRVFQLHSGGSTTFSHMWNLSDVPGSAADASDAAPAIPLTARVVITQQYTTGLPHGDIGVITGDGANGRLDTNDDGTLLNVATGSVVVLLTIKFTSAPGALRALFGKANPGGNYWYCRINADKTISFSPWDGSHNPLVSVSVDHVTNQFVDILVILDRDSASKKTSITSNLGDCGTPGDASTLGTLTNVGSLFSLLCVAGIAGAPDCVLTFAALGTTPGTLLVNRVEALARWRTSRNAT